MTLVLQPERFVSDSPRQDECDFARHSAGKADNFRVELVPKRTEFLLKKIVRLLREPFEGARPFGICDIDPAAAIAAITGGECQHLELMIALFGSDADQMVYTIYRFGLNFTRQEQFTKFQLLPLFNFLEFTFILHLLHFGIGRDEFEILGT
jgi:hypothetical protein